MNLNRLVLMLVLLISAASAQLMQDEKSCLGVSNNTAGTLKASDINGLTKSECMDWCVTQIDFFPGTECCQHTRVTADNGNEILYCTLFDSDELEPTPTSYNQMYGSVIQSASYTWGVQEDLANKIAGITASFLVMTAAIY